MPCAGVTIDAGILVVPDLGVRRDDAYRYVETLLVWSKLLDEPWIAICMSERSAEVLAEEGLYPLRDQITALFSEHRVVEFDANTVATVINRLLMHTPTFETYFRVRDVLADDCSTAPDILQLSFGNHLQSDLARCLVLIALLRAHCGSSVLNHALAIRASPRRLIRVRALVHDIEHRRDDFERSVPIPPEYFEGDVLTCDDFGSFVECIDERTVLNNASDASGVKVAIRISLYKSRLAEGLSPEWEDVDGWHMGSQFGETVRRCIRSAVPSLATSILRAIGETICRRNLAAVHALRTDVGGNSPQRRRGVDGARAFRRDIDRDYHLHYWELADAKIELASVGLHNDFSIPD